MAATHNALGFFLSQAVCVVHPVSCAQPVEKIDVAHLRCCKCSNVNRLQFHKLSSAISAIAPINGIDNPQLSI
jgi:hypothetical protein